MMGKWYVKNRRYDPRIRGRRLNDKSFRTGSHGSWLRCGCGGKLAPADLRLMGAIFGVRSAKCEVHLLRDLKRIGIVPGTPLAEQEFTTYCGCSKAVRRAQCVDATGKVVGSPKECATCGGIF